MSMNSSYAPLYPHHDLLMEIGQIELAMDDFDDAEGNEHDGRQPELQTRMDSLLEALDHLDV